MFEVTLEVNTAEVKRRLGVLADRSDRVIARAVNRTYTTGKNAIAREAAKDYRLRQKDVNNTKTLKITKATENSPAAFLDYTGNHRNLYLWDRGKAVSPRRQIKWRNPYRFTDANGVTQFRGGTPNVKTYKAAVTRGTGMHPLSGQPKPFVQRVRKGENSDFTGLFRRASDARDAKLVSVMAPSIPQVLKNEKVIARFEREAGAMLQKRLVHEIDNVVKGITK